MDFKYILFDVNRYSKEELLKLGNFKMLKQHYSMPISNLILKRVTGTE